MAAKNYMFANVSASDWRKIMLSHEGDPTSNVTPDFEAQFCYDVSNNKLYIAVGTANTAWELVTSS